MTMKMKWIDSGDLAAELAQRHPEVDPRRLRFTDLYQWVLALPEFDDDPERCGERILEALQQAWIDELD